MSGPLMTRPRRRALATFGLGVVLAAGVATGPAAADRPMSVLRLPIEPQQSDLDGGLAATAAEVHLPRTLAVVGAHLVLGYANALAVEPTGSSLRLSANGEPLADLPLVAAQGVVQADVEVPPALFRSGANVFGFRVVQHHRLDCTRRAFEELWTRIDAASSYLELQVVPRPGSLLLSNLDSVLAASVYDHEPLAVLTTPALSDPVVLEVGGLVVEGVALRRGTRPLEVRHVRLAPGSAASALTALRGQNVVVLGRLDELARMLPDPLPAAATNGLLAVLPLPADPQHVAIVVAGGDEQAIRRAAEVFRAKATAWPEAAAMAVGFAPLPAGAPPPATVEGGRPTTLAELGYASQDLPLDYTGTIEVPLTLPEDYYAGDGQRIVLDLNLAYGAGLAPTSALVVRVNGAPWNMLRLDRSDGALIDGTRIELPMGLFAPGANRIGLQPILHPADGALCARLGGQPMFSLFDDSRILVPAFAHLTRQPDLKLFATTAFPYGGSAAGETELVALRPDAATSGPPGRCAASSHKRAGAPLAGLVSSFGPPAGDRHLLVIGAAADLPAALVRAAPIPLMPHPATGDEAPARAPVRQASADGAPTPADARTPEVRSQWAQRLLADGAGADDGVVGTVTRWLIRIARAAPSSPAPAGRVDLPGLTAGSGEGALVAFRSPFAPDRTVTVLTAEDEGALGGAVPRMIEPSTWRRLEGDAAVWGAPSDPVVSRRLGETYLIAPLDTSLRQLWLLWRTWMAEQPAYWLAFVFATIADDAGRFEDARAWFERAQGWAPSAKRAEGLARAQAKLGHDQAVDTLAAAYPRQLGPLAADTARARLGEAFTAEDHAAVLAATRELDTPDAHNLRGWTFLRLQRPTEALLEFERVR